MKWFFAAFLSVCVVFLAVFGVRCVYGSLFPIKYQDEIAAASEEYGVEQAVIYSVINIESHFNKNAVSSKGAVGLMQVLPSTAQEVAGQDVDLTLPAQNIAAGTKYISKLIIKFDDLNTALCAYNAGPTNVAAWLKNPEYSDDGKTLKRIPFAETSGYIQKFQKNYKYYKSKV